VAKTDKFKLSVILDLVDKMTAPLKRSAVGLSRFGDKIGHMGARLAEVGRTAKRSALYLTGFATAGLFGLTRMTGVADKIGKTSKLLGISTDKLQELHFAARQSGVEVRTLDMAYQRFTRRLGEAKKMKGEAVKALQELRISLKSSNGEWRTSTDLFGEVADKLSKIEDPQRRVSLAFKFFDAEGVRLNNMLAGGAAGLKAYADQAHRMGLILSAETVAQAEKFNDVLDVTKTQMFALVMNAFPDLGKQLGAVAEKMSAWVNRNSEFLNQKMDVAIKNLDVSVALLVGTLGLLTGNPFLAITGFSGAAALKIKRDWRELGPMFDTLWQYVQWGAGKSFEWIIDRSLETVSKLGKTLKFINPALGAVADRFPQAKFSLGLEDPEKASQRIWKAFEESERVRLGGAPAPLPPAPNTVNPIEAMRAKKERNELIITFRGLSPGMQAEFLSDNPDLDVIVGNTGGLH
jgi:hypothetical protein